MPEDIVLRLTPEELYLLQSALRIDELPGFVPDLLSGLDHVQREQAQVAADHSLRARGLVGWDHAGHRVVNPVLARTLRDYAHPRYTLFVDTYVVSTRVIPFLYVFGEQGIYEQCQPEPDVLQLRVLANREELEKRLYPKLKQESQQPQYAPGRIVQRVLNAGIKVVRENEVAAQRLFAQSLWRTFATQLAIAYHNPQVVQYMARWQRTPTTEHPAPDAALTILQGQEGSYLFWVEEPDKGEDAPVTVQPASDESLRSYLAHLLPPYSVNENNS